MKENLQVIGYILMILSYTPTIIIRLYKYFKGKSQSVRSQRSESLAPSGTDKSKSRLGLLFVPSYLFRQEIVVIGGLGVILNFLGLAVSLQARSILYLDMTGTAVTALLLGPWWGAVVGTLSNSLLNPVLFSEGLPHTSFLPWTLVNIAGGLFWGVMGRRDSFRRYIGSTETSNMPHVYYLIKFGVGGAFLMSLFGTGVQYALTYNAGLSLHPGVASAMDRLLTHFQQLLRPPLNHTFGIRMGDVVSWALPLWLQNWLRFIPDKTISAAMALAIVRYGLPLFKKELISGSARTIPPGENWIGPASLVLAYSPSFIYLAWNYPAYWPLWICPLVIAGLGFGDALVRGPSYSQVAQARTQRIVVWSQVLSRVGGRPAGYGLWFGTAVASVFFLLGLPVLRIPVADFYRIALNFSLVVFGFVFAMRLGFVVAAQHRASSSLTAPPAATSENNK